MSNDAKREPFCWLEKRKLRNIAEVFAEGKLGSLAAARSVILALSEIASDKQSDTFTAATSYIAHRAGVTSKTVRRMIKTFKRLRFLHVQPRSNNGLKVANEYTLIRGNAAMSLVYPSLGKARKTDLPTREELSEESGEGTARKGKEVLAIDENDIVIHERTGERFNRRTGEYEW
jgi:DNA-binding IclR family transcriptional regulator